jgi:hypothetical protein
MFEDKKKAGWLMEMDGIRMVLHITACKWWELSTSYQLQRSAWRKPGDNLP